MEKKNYILKVKCLDKPGIISNISSFLFNNKLNILESSQFRDSKNNQFFMRVSFCPIEQGWSLEKESSLFKAFQNIAKKFSMEYDFFDLSKKQNLLIMVSKFGHCLNNVLYQWKTKAINANIPVIVSNHKDMQDIVKPYNIKYKYLPVNKSNKEVQEKVLINIVKNYKIDLIVLARYMQVLSPSFCKEMQGKIINIHHSFLPSFKGARPYQQAFLKGVKIIGATAHYVTDKLDEGQIIEQNVSRVNHTKNLNDFISIGRDIENLVLSKAINWHLQHRIIINDNRTVVFS